ncbi:hypothetical protein QTP88_008531 [Uroleucon formosanum]
MAYTTQLPRAQSVACLSPARRRSSFSMFQRPLCFYIYVQCVDVTTKCLKKFIKGHYRVNIYKYVYMITLVTHDENSFILNWVKNDPLEIFCFLRVLVQNVLFFMISNYFP